MPKISVIVPVYKVESYLHRCIDSIIGQSFTDFELILVDDGSPDECGRICDSYAQIDGKVRVIHQKNKGISAARNAGIEWVFKNSDSQWITFIDSDDWVHTNYLEYLLRAAESNGTSVSMCEYHVTDRTENEEETEYSSSILTPREAYSYKTERYKAYAWGRMYRTECFREVRFPEGRSWEDLATTYRVLFSCQKIAVVNCSLYYYFLREDSITSKAWHMGKLDELWAIEEQFEYFETADEDILRRLAEGYINCILRNLKGLEDACLSKKERRRVLRLLRDKMRRVLLKYGYIANMTYREKLYYSEIAYPRVMFIYWILIAQLQKMVKIRG